jgi:hypothetical protein
MKRMSNVNSFSAIIDRLIIENLKIFQFIENGDLEKADDQNDIISELKNELDIIFDEIKSNSYDSISEQRTFTTSDNVFLNLFLLSLNNYSISKGDKLKLEEIKKDEIDVEKLKLYIEFVRSNLELRSHSKNNLEYL